MTPKVPEQPVDPQLEAEKQRALSDRTAATQDRLAMDTSAVLARYGGRMALAQGLPPLGPALSPTPITPLGPRG